MASHHLGCELIPPSPPRIFNGGGDAHRVKGDAHPPLPYEHPSPPYVPVTPYEQLKFPRVINPDSPLNDSRQLDWGGVKIVDDEHVPVAVGVMVGRLLVLLPMLGGILLNIVVPNLNQADSIRLRDVFFRI